MKRAVIVCFGLIALLASVKAASADPITLQLNGTVNFVGFPGGTDVGFPSGTDLLPALGDPFSALVLYESGTLLSGPGPGDFYESAVLGIDVVIHTPGGDLHYVAAGQESATTANFASVHAGDLLFQILDIDGDGDLGSVRGPAVRAPMTVYPPNFLALEIGGPFESALLADSLPLPPFTNVAYTRLSIGFLGGLSPDLLQQAVVEGSSDSAQPNAVPDDSSTLLLLSMGLSALAMKRAHGRQS
jgi:hypothetical protein